MRKIFIWAGLFLLLISANIEAQRIKDIELFGYSKKLFDDGFYKVALGEFKQYLIEHPESEFAYVAQYYIGESYFQMNDFKNAAEQFLVLTSRYPDAPNATLGWEGMGRCYENMGDFKRAAEVFETAGKFYFYEGDVVSPFFLYAGKNHLKYGNMEKAKENFERIVNNYPGSDPAYEATYELGLIYLREGEVTSALKEFDKVKYVSEKPIISAGSRLLSGKIYMKIGDYKKGESELKVVIDEHKDQVEFFNDAKLNLGKVYVLESSYKKGRDLLEDFLKNTELSDSLMIRAMITIGESYHGEGNYLQAVANFNSVIDKYPLNSVTGEVFYKLALSYEAEGNEEQALYSFRRSLEFAKNTENFNDFQSKSLDKLIIYYERKGEYKEAADYLKSFLKHIEEKDEFLLVRVARLYEKGKDFLNAAEIYDILEREFAESPNVDNYIYKKGAALGKAGQYEKAVGVFEKLMNDFPGTEFSEDITVKVSFLRESCMQEDISDKERLKLFELFNRASGNVSKERAFEIGKYYYNIKEFSEAKSYFEVVLENEKDEEIISKAAEYISSSLDNIAKKYYIDGDILKYNIYLDSAFYAYGDYLGKGYFKGDFLDKARLRIAEINIEREYEEFEKRRKGISFYTLLAEDKNFLERDLALMKLGEIFSDLNNAEPNEIQTGRDYFNELIKLFPNSKYAGNAKFKLGYSFYISGETDNAADIFKKYLIEYPSGIYAPEVTAYLGRIKLNSGSETEASELFESLSKRFYYSSYVDSTAEEVGDFYFSKGDFEKAVKKYMLAFDRMQIGMLIEERNIDAGITDLCTKIAITYDSLGTLDKAILFLKDVIEKNQNVENISKVYYILGKVYERANYEDNAIEIYKEIEEGFPEEPFFKEVLEHKSELLFDMDRFADACEDFIKIADMVEDEAEKAYYKSRAIVCLYNDNNVSKGDAEAELFDREFKEISSRNFYRYKFLLEKGKAYYRSRNFSNAQKVFNDVANKGEKTELAPEAVLYIGLIYQARKDKVKAIKQFNSIQIKYPQAKIWSKIHNTLGIYYYSIGQYGDAAINFRMAIEKSESKKIDKLVMNNLILCYRSTMWYDSELARLREYIKIFPEADDIFDKKYNIGRALFDLGEYERAIEYLKPLLREATLEGEVKIQMDIAYAYEEMGMDEKAISELLKILYYGRSTIPKLNTTVRFRIAFICEKAGMYDKALQFYEEIIKIEGADSDFGRPAKEGADRVKERIKSIGG
ncbi:tetratricopeptide repeat protein [candidate division KSB1 bacterium]